MKIKTLMGTLLMAGLTATAFAQTPYLTGELTNPNWNPGTGKPYGAAQAGDPLPLFTDQGGGIWTYSIPLATLLGPDPGYTGTPPAPTRAVDTTYNYKVAGPGFSNPNVPSGDAKFRVPASFTGPVVFTWDTNTYTDGFVPSSNLVYNNATRAVVDGATSVQATGNFQAQIEAGTDYNPAAASAITLTDAGNGTSNDGIYYGTVTGLTAGSYEFKVVINQTFSQMEFGTAGAGGANLSFTVSNPSQTIGVTLNANTSRVKAADITAIPGPPFYATSAAWSEALDSTTTLFNNGDYFSRKFTVVAPGNYTARVRQGLGRSFPDSGNYPFTTTTANQEVVVVFDRKTFTDGYSPATDFVAVLGEAPSGLRVGLNPFNYVQPVGQLGTAFGAGDFNNDEPLISLKDDGVSPDTATADNIWSGSFTTIAANATAAVKVVARRLGVDTGARVDNAWVAPPNSVDDDVEYKWNIQIGGALDGMTVSGNNGADNYNFAAGTSYTFKVDTLTGRLGIATTAAKALSDPDRSRPYFTAQSEVADWMNY